MPRKKADIIEQLEKGKEILESGEIDVESLKTKITQEDDKPEEKPKKKRRSSKNNNDADTVHDVSNDKDNNFSDDNNTVSNNISSNDNSREFNEPRVEKYPGFDFTQTYSKGQTIFYVRVNDIIGEKELLELKLRTIYPKTLIGCIEKSYTQCIGPDTADRVFTNRNDALKCYNSIILKQRVFKTPGPETEDNDE